MNRLALILLLALAAAPALSQSKSRMSGGDGCNWYSQGEEITIDDTTYRCTCGKMNGPNGREVVCHWQPLDKLEARKRAKRVAKAKPRVRIVVRPVVA